MFFSISMPVYNAEKYLNRAIESVINQSEKDFELLLVDDGSIDRSAEICRTWELKYPDIIRYINKSNSGSLLTRRRCLEESKGEYLYIMDADDYLLSNEVLRIAKEKIISSKCDLLLFNCTTDIEKKTPYFQYGFESDEIFCDESLKQIYEVVLTHDSLNTLWNKIFHRSLVDWNADYSEYSHITNGTDFFQSLPIISNASRILYIDKIWYYYTKENNNSSIIHKFRPTIYMSMRENYKRLCYFSKLWKYQVPNREELLRQRMMKIASTAAYKTSLIIEEDKIDAVEYLRSIGDDDLFRNNYSPVSVSGIRRIIVWMLYHRMYYLLAKICMISRSFG